VTEGEFRAGVLGLLDELARRDAAALAAGVLEYVRRGLAEEGVELSDDADGSSLELS
jgi:hypothetical protein